LILLMFNFPLHQAILQSKIFRDPHDHNFQTSKMMSFMNHEKTCRKLIYFHLLMFWNLLQPNNSPMNLLGHIWLINNLHLFLTLQNILHKLFMKNNTYIHQNKINMHCFYYKILLDTSKYHSKAGSYLTKCQMLENMTNKLIHYTNITYDKHWLVLEFFGR